MLPTVDEAAKQRRRGRIRFVFLTQFADARAAGRAAGPRRRAAPVFLALTRRVLRRVHTTCADVDQSAFPLAADVDDDDAPVAVSVSMTDGGS